MGFGMKARYHKRSTNPCLLEVVPAMNQVSSSLFRLDDFAVMQVAGPDAVSFLQGQLTQDVMNQPGDRARLAGYCTAKGRLLASMLVWHGLASGTDEDSPVIYALMKSDIIE